MPFHRAVEWDKLDIVKVLIEWGADVNAKGKDGNSPLDCAKSKEMKDLLKQHGATK